MPRKNSRKTYLSDSFYHLYNRGIDKKVVFLDSQDHKIFLYFLKKYLNPFPLKDHPLKKGPHPLAEQIRLLAYCLMPNHFHLLLKQKPQDGITKFMRAIITNYVMYFNQKYKREGPLFQGVYKGVMVENDSQLLHLSRYIHLNPFELEKKSFAKLVDYSYSSYGDYLGKRQTPWLYPEEILSFFKTAQKTSLKDILSYQSFVEDYKLGEKEKIELFNLCLA